MTAFFVFWTLQIYLDWKDKRWENVRLCDPIFADHLTQQRKVEHTFLSSSLSGELQNFLEKNPFPKKCMWIVTVPNLIIKQNVPSFMKWSYWFFKLH